MTDIPRIMHQIWFQGQSELPKKYHEFQASWKRLNPTWKYEMWDETKMKDFIARNYQSEILDVFNTKTPYMHQKIDLFKHLVLYRTGGAYLDMDTMALQPLDNLIRRFPDKRVLISDGPGNAIEYLVSFGLPRMWNNGTLLAAPNHELYRIFIDEMVAALRRGCPEGTSSFKCINRTTGPTIFSRIIQENAPRFADVGLISRDFLEPCHGSDPFCKPSATLSIANHRHTLTWLSSLNIMAVKVYFTIKHYAPIAVAAAILFLVFRKSRRAKR